ncbi:MAG TPA: THUMP domain-containing protein [Candidatus Binatia bacterium]|jgi:tRNA(Ser,Leu) C12 N-acetylase TAN1|nr:THUMP domain-containing protein [Candidatus Binatia bacterium]
MAWNALATSIEGRRDDLLAALRRLAPFRPGGYRNVVVAEVDDPAALLPRVRDALAADARLAGALAKLVPLALHVRFEAPTASATFAAAAEPLLDRLAGKSFFVRLERRGMKGRLHTPTVEREVGDAVWRALEARGHAPRVAFRDPDVVLVIETLGDQAGIGVLDRATRTAFPFVKVR